MKIHKYQLITGAQLEEWERKNFRKDGLLTCCSCQGSGLEPKGIGEMVTSGGCHWHKEYIMNPCGDCSGTGRLEDTVGNRIKVEFFNTITKATHKALMGCEN